MTNSPSTTLWTDSGLLPDTTYTYFVRAFDAAGNYADSASISVKTNPDITSPSAPSNLNNPTKTETTIKIDWNRAKS